MVTSKLRDSCRSHLVEAVLEEVENAIDDCEGEVQRLQEVERRLLMENASGPECAGCHEEGADTYSLVFH